ncbi:MAG: diguanylate cyclase [Oceanospirillaceae bacterium]
MIFTEDANKAAVLLRKAVPKMIKHDIVPNPFNYTLWYSYYSQQFPELNTELDYVIDRFSTCPPEMSESLLLKYIIQKDETEEKNRDIFQQAIDSLVDGLSESIDQTAKQSNDFSSALSENIVSLGSCELGNDQSQLLNELSENANALCKINDSFQGEMLTAQSEINSLKAQLQESKVQANTDSLTGLSNRRVFESIYDKFTENNQQPEISLIMMDIDKFKVFNDTHGHLMGDQVLKFVGSLLKAECPEPLVPVRFGGEEFALLCPRVDMSQAMKIAEKLRVKLAKISLSNKRTGERLPPVTASFGVSVSKGVELLHHLVERADKALYMAKDNGRNCVQSLA